MNTNLLTLIEKSIPADVLKKHDTTAEYIANDVEKTIRGFGIKKSPEEIFLQELPWYMIHGMNAFDCGYCGKKLPETPLLIQTCMKNGEVKSTWGQVPLGDIENIDRVYLFQF